MSQNIKQINLLKYNFSKRFQMMACLDEDAEHVRVFHVKKIPYQVFIELQRSIKQPLLFESMSEDCFNNMLKINNQVAADMVDNMARSVSQSDEITLDEQQMDVTRDVLDNQDESAVVRFINTILNQAITQKASDIHFEVLDESLKIRYRLDGLLHDVVTLSKHTANSIISRLKVMAQCDIAEKRLPQDGRLSVNIAHDHVDIRLSTIPTHTGERVVLRILDKTASLLDYSTLGLSQVDQLAIKNILARPHGIVLVTGPTGSGKTTSLYAFINQLNNGERNILTVEQPVEYHMKGIGQTQVNTKIGMTFAKGLKAILRQDPDVVMVGEIRDPDTLETAIQASLTGHLVFSTLHTNTALGAITRLKDMGAASYLIASSLTAVIGQRLLRRLCSDCKVPRLACSEELSLMGLESECVIFEAKGCEHCFNRGYKGRVGVYDVVPINDEVRSMIYKNIPQSEIAIRLQRKNTLMNQAVNLVAGGVTSLSELLKLSLEDY